MSPFLIDFHTAGENKNKQNKNQYISLTNIYLFFFPEKNTAISLTRNKLGTSTWISKLIGQQVEKFERNDMYLMQMGKWRAVYIWRALIWGHKE